MLVASHYDSVPAGPGASDDGAGVAANLEVARVLQSRRPSRHSIIFLFDEGEEQGLLGAHAFVEAHPWAKEVRAVVNVDARGTSGGSLMFETGSANNWLIEMYVRAVPHPMTSSIYYAVYKLLPNDTDFSVFHPFGYQGFNFANIGEVSNITPRSTVLKMPMRARFSTMAKTCWERLRRWPTRHWIIHRRARRFSSTFWDAG